MKSKYFRPWPLLTKEIALAVFFGVQFAQTESFRMNDKANLASAIHALPLSFVLCVSTGGILWLSGRIINRFDLNRSLPIHILVAILASFPEAFLIHSLENVTVNQILYYPIRNAIFILCFQAIVGFSRSNLNDRLAESQAALGVIRDQSVLITDSEERNRRSIADFLHDHVQAQLVLLSMTLRDIAKETKEESEAKINSVVEELEDIRRFDIRDVGRRLSPDISEIGLQSAINELVLTYKKNIVVEFELQGFKKELNLEGSIDLDMRLGIYRIIEQALLNATAHGQAKKCSIVINGLNSEEIELKIENDGKPLDLSAMKRGAGLSLIDAWVSRSDGTWSLQNLATGQVCLTARLSRNLAY